MNTYLNKLLKTENVDYVIASDTDSIYLNMGPLVERIFKGREKTTEGIVSVSYTHLTLPTKRIV